MATYIFKRLLSMIPVFFIVTLLIFMIIHISPGDPAVIMLGENASVEQVEELREQLGLNLPIYQQYFNWVSGIFKGDLGYSFFREEPVMDIVLDHFHPTLVLAILSQVLTVIIGVPLGIMAATNRGTYKDSLFMGVSLLGVSIPGFLLGLLFVLFFSVKLGWFPVSGYQSFSEGVLESLKYLILPSISLACIQVAMTSRMTRSSMLDILNKNFISAIKAKGVSNWNLIYKHALKNSFLPILTVLGETFVVLVTGAVVIEVIFEIPGIGRLIIYALDKRDYFLIQGIVVLITFIFVFINLIIDILYTIIDPRVKLD